MVGLDPKSRRTQEAAKGISRRVISWRIVFQQHLMSPGPLLAALPTSFRTQGFFSHNVQQEPQQQSEPEGAAAYKLAAEMFRAACDRLNLVSDNLGKATDGMKEMTAAILARETACQARAFQPNKTDLDLRLGRNYAGERKADVPASSQTQNMAWIQFADSPRCGVDGMYLRDWLARDVDLSEPMAFAIGNLLNCKQDADSDITCHYVLHDWAAKALDTGSSTEECLGLFDRQKKNYKLKACTRIVPFILLGEQWASLSIDLVRKSTLLIHPTLSSRPHLEVEEEYRPLCQHLTYVALSNMTSLTSRQIDTGNWSFGVALQQEHPIERNNAGVVTYYYSIPKENQFMIVSDATIENAKQTFIHELVKMCNKLTKKKVQKGVKNVTKGKKRKPDGTFAKEKPNGKHFRETETPESSASSAEVSRAPSTAAAPQN